MAESSAGWCHSRCDGPHDECAYCCDACHRERVYDAPAREVARARLADYRTQALDGLHTYARSDTQSATIHSATCSVMASLTLAPVLMTRADVDDLNRRRRIRGCELCAPELPAPLSDVLRKLNRYGRIKSGLGWPA